MNERQDVLDRLAALERDNRRWKRAGGALALALLASVAIGFTNPRADVVEAERFVLKGADGTELGSLGVDSQGAPMLLMRKDSAYVALATAAPGLILRGTDGKRGVFLGVDGAGSTLLELTSDKLQQGVKLATHADGSSGVYLRDEAGFPRATMEALSTGDAIYTVRADKGALRGTFSVDSNGNSSSMLLDSLGRRRIGMVVGPDGTPLLSLDDEETRTRASLSMIFDGSPLLELYGESGEPTFEAP